MRRRFEVNGEERRAETGMFDRQLAYWTKQLAGAPTVLELPSDRPRPSVRSLRKGTHRFALPWALGSSLRELSKRAQATPFMALITVFAILLYRYTGQNDVLIGSPVTGGTLADFEEITGFFVNLLVLRTKLTGSLTFADLLSQIRQTVWDAYAHRDLPFQRLVEELQIGPVTSHHPLFQVMFQFQHGPSVERERGTEDGAVSWDASMAKCDLMLSVADQGEELLGAFEYSSDLFDAATVERMAGHFQVLLDGVIGNPHRPIGELPLLTVAERRQILVDWNTTQVDYPLGQCIHHLFEAQVARTPEAVAVVYEDRQLSYRNLNDRANQLGHSLLSHGVGPDVLVGLCMERSPEMVIGMLAILKAGGAYVPLDPAHPPERLAFMVRDAQMSIVLTQPQLTNRLPAGHTTTICLGSDWSIFEHESAENLSTEVTAENLAYVMYTSGSTGKPKGVMIPHRGLVNYLSWATKAYEVAARGGAPVHSSIGFDLTITSLFSPLLVGRRVVLLPEHHGVDALSALLRREKDFSLIKITPAHLEVLSQELQPGEAARCAGAFIIGGEALWGEQLTFWCAHAPGTRLINEYGPTETVVGCCVYEVPAGSFPSGPVPIGRPIANTELYILDRHHQPAPIGVPGELYIGGMGLARGYLNSPELTADKFIDHPFSSEPKARLYKTGDLVRYQPDGTIEYLGRLDDQVKIRGFRIELGEIEAALLALAAIEQAVVLVREDIPGDKRLVAYLVCAPGQTLQVESLRSQLQQQLPVYMVPSAFVPLNALPLTSNGKVDRRALPSPDQSRPGLEKTFVAPNTRSEEVLAKIWANLLKLEQVGIHDNFFDLGGHSLLAVRLMSQIEKSFGKKLPLAILFQAPTIEQLAELIIEDVVLPTWSSLYPIQPHGSKPPFFWVHGEASDAFLPRYLGPDQPLYGLRHQSEDGTPARYHTVVDIAAHYLSEIRTVQPQGPYFLGGYCFGALVAFEIAQQLKKLNQGVPLLVLLDPVNPRVGPLSASAPMTFRSSTNGTSLVDEISRHRLNLESLKANEKVHYVLERAKGKIMNITSPFDKTLKKMAYEACLALGYPIPPSLRSRYILDIYDQSLADYVPEVHPGRLMVFKAAEDCDPDRWERLALLGLEIHEIPGNHTNILKEPYLHGWAELLKIQIDSAQSQFSAREKSVRSPFSGFPSTT